MDAFTKTETRRRLRQIAAEARTACHLASNVRVEVGVRWNQLAVPATFDFDGPLTAEDDDLSDFEDFDLAASSADIRRHGSLVHLYLSTTGRDGELQDVVVGWTGTPDADARLVDVNGTRVKDVR